MGAQPSYWQCAVTTVVLSCRRRRRHCYTRLVLIGAFGVLAFIFSAISPEDDDIQQEFIQGNEQKYSAVADYKAGHPIRIFGRHIMRPLLLLRSLPKCARADILSLQHDNIEATTFSSRTGDRSPPSQAS
jgi:hypothetical protein